MSNFFLLNKFQYNYFLILFIFIPLSFIIGPLISLINILLIDISFIIYLIYNKEYSFLKTKPFKYLLILYIYLIFNSLISFDQSIGLMRNLGFVRMIIFFIAVNYFFNQKLFFSKVFLGWSIFFSIILTDVFIESFYGKNILGYGGEIYAGRIVSFFEDEPIVGGFINAFYLILTAYIMKNFRLNSKIIFLILSLIILFSIIITGERSNSIKAFLALSFFFLLYKEYAFRTKILFFSFAILSVSLAIINSPFLKHRFIDQISDELKNFDNNIYYKLQLSGLETFNNNKLFGVGNKNYRLITCQENEKPEGGFYNEKYACSTHPHQIYFDFLSEHGLVGFSLLMWIFYKLIFSKIRTIFLSNNYVHIGSFCYLLFTFTPLIPSGAFFNDYLLTLFFINLSIFYGSNPDMNIYNKFYKK